MKQNFVKKNSPFMRTYDEIVNKIGPKHLYANLICSLRFKSRTVYFLSGGMNDLYHRVNNHLRIIDDHYWQTMNHKPNQAVFYCIFFLRCTQKIYISVVGSDHLDLLNETKRIETETETQRLFIRCNKIVQNHQSHVLNNQ